MKRFNIQLIYISQWINIPKWSMCDEYKDKKHIWSTK